jgi:hypothetical protein
MKQELASERFKLFTSKAFPEALIVLTFSPAS